MWCLQTHKFAARADRKKTCSLFQSCWAKAVVQVKFSLTSWCSVHSLSLPVVFVKPCYALMWSWNMWAHDLMCCNCGEDKPKGSVCPLHKDSVATSWSINVSGVTLSSVQRNWPPTELLAVGREKYLTLNDLHKDQEGDCQTRSYKQPGSWSSS